MGTLPAALPVPTLHGPATLPYTEITRLRVTEAVNLYKIRAKMDNQGREQEFKTDQRASLQSISPSGWHLLDSQHFHESLYKLSSIFLIFVTAFVIIALNLCASGEEH